MILSVEMGLVPYTGISLNYSVYLIDLQKLLKLIMTILKVSDFMFINTLFRIYKLSLSTNETTFDLIVK